MDKAAIDLKKQGRLKEWRAWLLEFQDTFSKAEKADLELIENAPELLNDYYWRQAKQFIRPLLEEVNGPDDHNIHYYKIISASELTVMVVLPWKYKKHHTHTSEVRAEVNARFAYFVAISIMLNWKINNKEVVELNELKRVTGFIEMIDKNKEGNIILYPYNFTQEHITWLKELNVHGPLPILSNSQTWRLCYLACVAIRNKGKLK